MMMTITTTFYELVAKLKKGMIGVSERKVYSLIIVYFVTLHLIQKLGNIHLEIIKV